MDLDALMRELDDAVTDYRQYVRAHVAGKGGGRVLDIQSEKLHRLIDDVKRTAKEMLEEGM